MRMVLSTFLKKQIFFCSKEICGSNITLCPTCELCDTTKLSDQCSYSKIKYLFNNTLTPWFAFFVAIWATLYLEIWKRYSARILFNWDMSEFTQQVIKLTLITSLNYILKNLLNINRPSLHDRNTWHV
jgi:hypothetical protein